MASGRGTKMGQQTTLESFFESPTLDIKTLPSNLHTIKLEINPSSTDKENFPQPRGRKRMTPASPIVEHLSIKSNHKRQKLSELEEEAASSGFAPGDGPGIKALPTNSQSRTYVPQKGDIIAADDDDSILIVYDDEEISEYTADTRHQRTRTAERGQLATRILSTQELVDASPSQFDFPSTSKPTWPEGFIDPSLSQEEWHEFRTTLFGSTDSTLAAASTVAISLAYRLDGTSFRVPDVQFHLRVLTPDAARGYGICVADAKSAPWFIDLTPTANHLDIVPLDSRWMLLVEILETRSILAKICFAAKDALKPIIAWYPALRACHLFDPQIACWVYSTSTPARHSFSSLCTTYLHEDVSHVNVFKPRLSLLAKDTLLSMRLMSALEALLLQVELIAPFIEQEMPLVAVLARMELIGVAFDNTHLLADEAALRKRLERLQDEANRRCGFYVLLSSPKQVGDALFNRLKLQPSIARDRTLAHGQPATSESVLHSMIGLHPLPELVLEYRRISKYLTNWIVELDKKQYQGRMYTTLLQTGTATGRLSSMNPNLQNLPRSVLTLSLEPPRISRTQRLSQAETSVTVNINIRSAFVASPNHLLLAADYSQLEMRLLALIAGEANLLDFFSSGKDVHVSVAAKCRSKPIEDVSPAERESAKRLVYGIMYGMGPVSLSEHLGVSRKEAKEFMDQFLSSYPAIQKFILDTKHLARSTHEIRTIYGRRRILDFTEPLERDFDYVIGVTSGPLEDQSRPDRQAVNSVIQGTAADIVKRAMIHISSILVSSTSPVPSARLLLQIHDELLFECLEADLPKLASLVKRVMEQASNLPLSLPVSLKCGTRWGEMTSLLGVENLPAVSFPPNEFKVPANFSITKELSSLEHVESAQMAPGEAPSTVDLLAPTNSLQTSRSSHVDGRPSVEMLFAQL